MSANPGATPNVAPIYNSTGCAVGQLELIGDAPPEFNLTSGTLRVPVVVKNVGTDTIHGPLRVRFVSDSVHLYNAAGHSASGQRTSSASRTA